MFPEQYNVWKTNPEKMGPWEAWKSTPLTSLRERWAKELGTVA